MDYKKLKTKLLSIQEDTKFRKGANIEEIKEAEKILGVKLPESYKRFLQDFNGGGIGHFVICGIGEDHPDYQGMNIVKLTLELRNDYRPNYYIPNNLIPFYDYGNGDYDCFDTNKFEEGECPVVVWNHETFFENLNDLTKNYEVINKNFIEWLNKKVESWLEYKQEQ
ncbi:MAG: hypothetical protein A7316_02185 [Candidatus Altiarchaeales archaeon WOR_SM1_86-2]|nr:MAG: hypothetical protein A7316_02185 [Candidatus Altiarchaeales archaeon WOR_SM1_86-2]